MIQLKDITMDNWKECIRLKLHKEEENFIHPNVYSIAEAQFYSNAISKAIYNNNSMVGYTMFGEDDNNSDVYYIDRLMISKDHRNQGFAAETLNIIIDDGKAKGYKRISTSVEPENSKMIKLLVKNGFYTNNEMDGNEVIYHYDLLK